ncbi:histidine--tRNA ligase [Desulfosediminicola ganghwensis]|uniref:histidine--tRNA ligase n=1 Tax=Desulfosediminicola ganghwensis TaxID=2569540 RepID=UPI0010AD5A01|nr:histidine--tRNA ligase [Desulfosediminicola ganghwensis]
MKLKALNGFKDILPADVALWMRVEATVRDIVSRFQFSEIRLPILEKTELFARSIGEATDIVEKEMYSFVDKGVTMRPEATAQIIRAYIEHGLYVQRPIQRIFTIGPMFRHERPQKGRLRQFHQVSAEVIGADHPRVDAEVMAMSAMIFSELGISVSLEMNSLGCRECRPAYKEKLLAFLSERIDHLCDDCKRRSSTNPLRVLDCKKPGCREQVADAPSIVENLCAGCDEHFGAVRSSLEQLGVDYQVNKFMVRGLDYYCRTTFEFITGDLGAQSAVCAGGRYDGLVEQLGGPKKIGGIGFGLGLERLVLLLQQKEQDQGRPNELDLFIAGLGEEAVRLCYGLVNELRVTGLRVGLDHEGRSLKSQMKQADKAGSNYVLIVGDDELAKGTGVLRNMGNQEQINIALDAAAIQQQLAGA